MWWPSRPQSLCARGDSRPVGQCHTGRPAGGRVPRRRRRHPSIQRREGTAQGRCRSMREDGRAELPKRDIQFCRRSLARSTTSPGCRASEFHEAHDVLVVDAADGGRWRNVDEVHVVDASVVRGSLVFEAWHIGRRQVDATHRPPASYRGYGRSSLLIRVRRARGERSRRKVDRESEFSLQPTQRSPRNLAFRRCASRPASAVPAGASGRARRANRGRQGPHDELRALPDAERLTPVGRLLRLTSVDELPQLPGTIGAT